MGADARSRRIAVVADAFLPRLLDRLEKERWGVIQLPPGDLDADTAAAWLDQVAEHVAEFERTGYTLVHVSDGVYDDALADALRKVGAPALRKAGAELS